MCYLSTTPCQSSTTVVCFLSTNSLQSLMYQASLDSNWIPNSNRDIESVQQQDCTISRAQSGVLLPL